jgi:hypothetical protein
VSETISGVAPKMTSGSPRIRISQSSQRSETERVETAEELRAEEAAEEEEEEEVFGFEPNKM